MTTSYQCGLRREIHSKGTVYAWSQRFLHDLMAIAADDPSIEAEAFAAPVPVEGLVTPPIGVARLREDRP